MKAARQTKHKKALLRQMAKPRDVMKGSLARSAVTCGKKICKCQRGQKHPAVYFSYQSQGKQRVIHVPHQLVDEVERLNKNWKELKGILEKLTAENARLIVRPLTQNSKENSRAGKKRSRSAKTSAKN